ncbi:MAG: ribosome recycling factor [Myxococcota bacterium]
MWLRAMQEFEAQSRAHLNQDGCLIAGIGMLPRSDPELTMLDTITNDTKAALAKAHEAFRRELQKLRTGRANLAMLDGVRVDTRLAPPLNQVAALNVADPRLITIDRGTRRC